MVAGEGGIEGRDWMTDKGGDVNVSLQPGNQRAGDARELSAEL